MEERKEQMADIGNHNRKKRMMINGMLAICIVIFLVSAAKLFLIFREYKAGEEEYQKLQEYVSIMEIPSAATATEGAGVPETGEENAAKPKVDSTILYVNFEELKKLNPEIVAWIYIPGLDISYPVVQGSDNEYYLTHTATGEKNRNGSIFLASENGSDFTDDNTIIYGHNMKNNTMFANLHRYKDVKVNESFPYIYVYTPEYSMIYQIFSSYTGAANGISYTYRVGSDTGKAAFFGQLQSMSDHVSELAFTDTDTIITLSTCLDDNSTEWRYLIHARLISREPAKKDTTFELEVK